MRTHLNLLVKNKHTAPISPPPAKGFPVVVFAPGVTPIAPDHWDAIVDHPSMLPFHGLLEVIDPDVMAHVPEEPNATVQGGGGGDGSGAVVLSTSPLPPLGGAK